MGFWHPSLMQSIIDAITAGADTAEFAALPLPESYRAVTVHKDEATMFDGMASRDKDPRSSIHLDEVPVPELAPGEALIAVMASSINYNTVWTSIFEPVSTFGFLERYGKLNPYAKRHDLPYHIIKLSPLLCFPCQLVPKLPEFIDFPFPMNAHHFRQIVYS